MLQEEIFSSALLQSVAAKCKTNAVLAEKPSVATKKHSWFIPGFGAGARVATSFGHVPVEALRCRDEIRTREGCFLRIQHIDTIRLDRRFLLTHPDAQPIAIPKNGLAPDVPNQNILVSGSQKIGSPKQFDQISGRMASEYVGQTNIMRKNHGYFTYYVFHCGEPCTASVDGLWVDLDPDALGEIEE